MYIWNHVLRWKSFPPTWYVNMPFIQPQVISDGGELGCSSRSRGRGSKFCATVQTLLVLWSGVLFIEPIEKDVGVNHSAQLFGSTLCFSSFLYQGLLQHIGMLGIFLSNPSTFLLSFLGVPHGISRQRIPTMPHHQNYDNGTDCVMLNIGSMSRSVPKKCRGMSC